MGQGSQIEVEAKDRAAILPAERRRLAWSLLAPALLSVLVMGLLAYVGLSGLDRVSRQAQIIVDRNLESSVRISDITARTRSLNGELYRLMTLRAANTEGVDVTKELAHIAEGVGQLISDLESYRDSFAQPSQVAAINAAIEQLREYQQAVEFVGSMLEMDFASAVAFIRPFNGLFDNLANLLHEMTQTTVDDARRLTNAAAEATQQTSRWFLAMSVFIAGGVSAFAWAVGKRQQKIIFNSLILEKEVADRTADLRRTAEELHAAKVQAEGALTEVQRTQKQLVEAEKMAALGSLVAGVAHEINTPVGTSLTAATLLEERTRKFKEVVLSGQIKKADLTKYLELADETTGLMLTNIHRAAELIQSFKQVAVDQTSSECRPFNLGGYLDEVLTSLRPRLRKSSVEVTVTCDPEIEMFSFAGAFSQVITNLVMNALTHAFDEGQEGHITLAVSAAARDRVSLAFHDNGKGIPADNLGRIFEPFFTTKRGTGGTGLGLHIVYNIVSQQLGGTIAVASELGQGTTFVIELPVRINAEASMEQAV